MLNPVGHSSLPPSGEGVDLDEGEICSGYGHKPLSWPIFGASLDCGHLMCPSF